MPTPRACNCCYNCIFHVANNRVELLTQGYEPCVIPFHQLAIYAVKAGFEPTNRGYVFPDSAPKRLLGVFAKISPLYNVTSAKIIIPRTITKNIIVIVFIEGQEGIEPST